MTAGRGRGLSGRRKLENVSAETTSSGSPFQIQGPEMFNVRLPTVDSWNVRTTRRLELAGSEFQTVGPAMENVRVRKVLRRTHGTNRRTTL